jgi:ABC-type Fe3+-hydroxamate transport system substrate-binding protein
MPIADTRQPLHDDLRRVSLRERGALRRLGEETETLPEGDMSLTPESAQLLVLLARLMGAKRVLEVGTFTSYSAFALALALPADGKIIACDVKGGWTSLALEPDLILGSLQSGGFAGVEPEPLARIAPVIALGDHPEIYRREWPRDLGVILGRADAAETRMAEHRALIEATCQAVQAALVGEGP